MSGPAPKEKSSQSNYTDVRVTHMALDLVVDFEAQKLVATTTFTARVLNAEAKELILDTKELVISSVSVEGACGSKAHGALGNQCLVQKESVAGAWMFWRLVPARTRTPPLERRSMRRGCAVCYCVAKQDCAHCFPSRIVSS
jgi:hypothetical protein